MRVSKGTVARKVQSIQVSVHLETSRQKAGMRSVLTAVILVASCLFGHSCFAQQEQESIYAADVVIKNSVTAARESQSGDVVNTTDSPAVAQSKIGAISGRRDTTLMELVVDSIRTKIVRKINAPIVQVPLTAKSLILPGALFAYGALTLNKRDGAVSDINREFKSMIWDRNPHEKAFPIEDYTLLMPAVAVYALNFAGYKGHNNIVDRSIMFGMANVINNALSFGIKRVGIEKRPDGMDYKSFPSGHTSQAFVSAEFARLEYKGISPWPGIAGYAVAISTAYLRMYNNHHWFSDVVAGAGVGIASTRIAYYLYPALKHHIFGSNKIKGNVMIMPTYAPGGVYGVAMTYRFP